MPSGKKLTHSGIGIASFIISIVVTIETFITFLLSGVLAVITPGGLNQDSASAVIIGFVIIFFLIISVVGIGLGIGGMLQKKSNKIFSLLGLIFNLLLVIGTLLVISSGLKK